MFFNALRAEWTKLTTTKGLYWNLFVYALMVFGFTALMVFADNENNKKLAEAGLPQMPVDPRMALMVVQAAGLILIILASMMITTEYGHKYATMSFQATPRRSLVALAKLLLMSVIGALLGLLSLGIYWLGYRLFGHENAVKNMSLDNHDFARMLWAVPVYIVMLVLLAQAVAWLVRNSAGTIVIMLVWYMVLENAIIPLLPKIGEKIHPYGPLSNLGAFVANRDLDGTPWNVMGSFGYFAAIAGVLYIVALVLLSRRDA